MAGTRTLAGDAEDAETAVIVELDEVDVVDGPDTELALDGADQRGALEQRAGERLEGARELRLAAGDLVVEADDAEVLLTGALLRLDEAGGAVDAGRGQYEHRARGGWDTHQTIRQPVTLGSSYCTVSIHQEISSSKGAIQFRSDPSCRTCKSR